MINIISQVVAVRISSVFFRKNNCMIVIFQRIIFTLSNLKMRCFVRISQCSSCYFIEIKSILINLIIPQISMSLDYIILYVFINFFRPLLIKTDKIFRCQVCRRQIRVVIIVTAQSFRSYAIPCFFVFIDSR